MVSGFQYNISVIVPLFQGKKYINSILEQIEKGKIAIPEIEMELVLVNDDPSDAIEKIQSEIVDVVVINNAKNIGIHGSRVIGLNASKGNMVHFMDQDDLVGESFYNEQVKLIENNDAVICKCVHEGKKYYSTYDGFQDILNKNSVLNYGNPIITPGQVLIKKESIPSAWKNNIMRCNGADDLFLWILMISNRCSFAYNQEYLFEHVTNGANTSWDYSKMFSSEKEMCDLLKNNNIWSEQEIDLMFLNITMKKISNLGKFKKMFFILNGWMQMEEKGRTIEECLIDDGIHNIAIYGGSFLGKRLYGLLKNSNVKVEFFIDRNGKYIDSLIPVFTLEEYMNHETVSVDAIIVCIVEKQNEIIKELRNKVHVKVIYAGNLTTQGGV